MFARETHQNLLKSTFVLFLVQKIPLGMVDGQKGYSLYNSANSRVYFFIIVLQSINNDK